MSSNVINNLSVINHPIVKANNSKDYNKDIFLQYLRKIQKFAILTKEEEEYHTKNY